MTRIKSRAIIIAGVTLIAMFILAAGISQINLKPGQTINLGDLSIQAGSYGTLFNGDFILYLFYGMYVISSIALLILVIYMLLTPERRRKLLRFLASLIPILVIALFIANYVPSCSNQTVQPLHLQTGIQATPGSNNVPQSTFNPNLSPGIILATSIFLALVIAGLAALIIFRLRQRNSRQSTPLMKLAESAQTALDTLHGGGDLKNIILRCYFEMCRILIEQRSLHREQSMTPHEFEQSLIANGLPGEPVQILTRLFEEVRYGVKQAGQPEEYMAESSLRAIIDACKVAR